MTLFDAICTVLQQADAPLHYQTIAERILDDGLWTSAGQTPAASVSAVLTSEIKQGGEEARFVRTAPGTYALRSIGHALETSDLQAVSLEPEGGVAAESLSFNDAAALVLETDAGGKPMHYKAITERVLALGLIVTKGQTPAATMNAQLTTEIAKASTQGTVARFVAHGQGYYGLATWEPTGIVGDIEQHNAAVRQQLHTWLASMDPTAFEHLVGALLLRLDFEDVVVTVKSGDGGVDVRGVLVELGGLVRTRYAIQVKRWKHNVQAPEIQHLRGSLAADEHGLFVTLSEYSAGAMAEATAPGKTPIRIINGKQFLGLLIAQGMGVGSTPVRLLEFDPDTLPEGMAP